MNDIDYEIVDKVIVIDDVWFRKIQVGIVKSLNLKKIEVIFSEKNLGVSEQHWFQESIKKKNFDILFKLDGDGQHDPIYINGF